MSSRPTANNEPESTDLESATQPSQSRALAFGVLAGAAYALIYGVTAEPIGLTFGLLGVAFLGGMGIGAAVKRGAWNGRAHPRTVNLQWLSVAIAIGAWIVAVFAAYLLSQLFFPNPTSPLLERLSLAGFADYFVGLFDQIRLIHAASLAIVAVMAWRGAR